MAAHQNPSRKRELSRGAKGESVQKWRVPAHSRLLLSLEAIEFRFEAQNPEIA